MLNEVIIYKLRVRNGELVVSTFISYWQDFSFVNVMVGTKMVRTL